MSQEASAKPQKQSNTLVVALLVVVVLLLAGGGAGAYWILTHRDVTAKAAPPPPDPGIVAFDPFVVNLADPGSTRFLRVTLRLVVEDAKHAKEMEENELGRMRVRSAILELLTQQSADHLVTPEGKAELKKAIAERATHALHDVKVTDVLFTEFVVQF
jgi:flagellar FliL protein